MFNFIIELPKNWDDQETLPNTPIEGVNLNSPLGILISSLQGNFVHSLMISKSNVLQVLYDRLFSSVVYMKVREDKETREEFLLRNCASLACPMRLVGKEKQLSKKEFQALCDSLKKANLHYLSLHVDGLPFTEEEEQELIDVIKANRSIQSLTMIRGTKEMANAIKAIERPSLELVEIGLVNRDTWKFDTDETFRAEVIQQIKDERSLMNAQAEQATINMHLLQGFVTVLGATTVATAFVLLGAASLNPAGVVFAASGTVALALGVHSFFSRPSQEPERYTPTEQKFYS